MTKAQIRAEVHEFSAGSVLPAHLFVPASTVERENGCAILPNCPWVQNWTFLVWYKG
jgi:hypothetical protein